MLRDTYKTSLVYQFICTIRGKEINLTPYMHLFYAIGDYSDELIAEKYPGKEEEYQEALDRRFEAMLKYVILLEESQDLQYHSHKPLYCQMLSERSKEGFIDDDGVTEVLARANTNERWDLFAYYMVQNCPMTANAFAAGLKQAWDSGIYDEAQVAILLFSMAVPDCIMDEKEMALYNRLPEKVQIYRGTSRFENDGVTAAGMSWTIDRGVAEYFAFRGRSHKEEDGRVYVAEVFKEDILAIIEERGEREVILSEDAIESVIFDGEQSILTEKKTEFYDRYAEEVRKNNTCFLN